MQVLRILNFIISENTRKVWKFTDLSKLLTLIQKQFYQFLSKLCTCPWTIHSSKNNFEVRRYGYLYFFFIYVFIDGKRSSHIYKTS